MKDTDSLVPAMERTVFFEEYKLEFYVYIMCTIHINVPFTVG